MTAIISRTKGHCSVCPRGRGKGANGVVLIKMAMPKYTWLGLCLVCAKAVAKEVSR